MTDKPIELSERVLKKAYEALEQVDECQPFVKVVIQAAIAEHDRERENQTCEWTYDPLGIYWESALHEDNTRYRSMGKNMPDWKGCPECMKRIHVSEEPTT